MWWKYWFPVLLCLVFALMLRFLFVFISEYDRNYFRIPRLLFFVLVAFAFIPIINYLEAVLYIALIVAGLCCDGLTINPALNTESKFWKWLLSTEVKSKQDKNQEEE